MLLNINVLKFQQTSCLLKRPIHKQCRPRSDCFLRSSLIMVFPVCYSDSVLQIPALISNILLQSKTLKAFEILEQLPYTYKSDWYLYRVNGSMLVDTSQFWMIRPYTKVRKHMTCEVILATVRRQPYWKWYPYAVSFFAYFSITQKL